MRRPIVGKVYTMQCDCGGDISSHAALPLDGDDLPLCLVDATTAAQQWTLAAAEKTVVDAAMAQWKAFPTIRGSVEMDKLLLACEALAELRIARRKKP